MDHLKEKYREKLRSALVFAVILCAILAFIIIYELLGQGASIVRMVVTLLAVLVPVFGLSVAGPLLFYWLAKDSDRSA